MPHASIIQASFNGGEISEQAQGRVDLERYLSSCRTLENFVPTVPGPARKRSGTRFVSEVHDSADITRLIPFEYSRTQAYVLEFGDAVMRVYKDGGLVLETVTRSVSSITTGSPTTITTTANHEWNTGDRVTFSGVTGTDAALLNGKVFVMTRTGATTFTVPVSTSGALANGTISRVFQCKTPYTSAQLDELQYAQSADVLYLTHPSVQPYKLLRHDHDEWTFVPYPTADLDRSVSVTSITNANPGVATTATSHGYASGDRILIFRARGMTEVNGNIYYVKNPTALTFELASNVGLTNLNTTSFREFVDSSSECVVQKVVRNNWPPFANENLNTQSTMVANAEDVDATVSVFSSSGEFTSAMVGQYLRLREVPAIEHSEWKAANQMGGGADEDRAAALNVGDFCQYAGNVYELITKTGTKTGLTPPTHIEPGEQQTDHKWTWEYAHGGSGFVEILSFVTAYRMSGRVRRRLPASAVDVDALKLATSNTANPCQITTSTNHNWATGDRVFIYDMQTATELNNRTYTITVTGATTLTLDGVDAGTFGAGTNGFAIRMSRGTHRWSLSAWGGGYGNPRSATFFEDRLWFGGSDNQPQTIWGSETSVYDSHNVTPIETSALSFTINAEDQNVIEWITSQRQLYFGTAGGEFAAQGVNPDAAISQSNILRPLRMTEHGVRPSVQPVLAEGAVLFAQSAGRKIREFLYDYQNDTYRALDLSALAEHILKGQVRWMDFEREPDRVVWIVLDDGKLVGLTYDRSLTVAAFHRHTIGGASVAVESVAVIPHEDGDSDQVWLLVKRTVNGSVVRHVEYMEKAWLDGNALEDAFFVDAGLTYDGAPATTITGLEHLVGQTVQALADGVYAGTFTVSASGTITLLSAAGVVQVGLPMGGSATTGAALGLLRPEAGAANGTAQGKVKRVESIILRLHQAGSGLYFGAEDDFTKMDPLLMKDGQDPSGTAITLLDGDTKELPLNVGYGQTGHVTLRHVEPLPCTVVAVMQNVETEDRA